MTSASLQSYSRNRRIMAQMTMAADEAFDATQEPCKRDQAMIVTRTVTGVAYHFRTPSPGGQVSCPYVDLPVSPPFKLTWRLLAQERDAANHDLYCTRKPPCVSRSSQNEKRGKFPCRLNHRFLFWHVAADWPRAAIRSDNRPLLAVLLVPGQLLSSAEVSQPVSLSGPRATWFIARHTHRAANRSRSNNRKQRDGAALEAGCGVFLSWIAIRFEYCEAPTSSARRYSSCQIATNTPSVDRHFGAREIQEPTYQRGQRSIPIQRNGTCLKRS